MMGMVVVVMLIGGDNDNGAKDIFDKHADSSSNSNINSNQKQ